MLCLFLPDFQIVFCCLFLCFYMKKSLIYEEEFDVSYDNDLKCSTCFISLYHNCLWRFMSFLLF